MKPSASGNFSITSLFHYLLIAIAIAAAVFASNALSQSTAELISIGIDGQAGDGDNFYVSSEIRHGAMSNDGRYIVFSSLAQNLTSDEVSGWQVYLRDRSAGTTTLVSQTLGDLNTGASVDGQAVISADGRYIAFRSNNGNLVVNDTNGATDIFVFDTVTTSLNRISVSSDGSQGNGCSCGWPDYCNGCESYWVNSHPAISSDGRFIAFTSYSSNFVDGDVSDTPDVFIHDQQTATTSLISRAVDGNIATGDSGEPVMSADGLTVAFSSAADNLVFNDHNGKVDVFLLQRESNALTRISIAADGSEGDSNSTDPTISADGRLVAYSSGATNLVRPDSNGYTADIFVYDNVSGSTVMASSLLASGGSRPSISTEGGHVSFTSGTDDIFLYDIGTGMRQLVNDYMQFSTLGRDGNAVVVSGYDSLVSNDTNGDKDVYLIEISDNTAPGNAEICDDGLDNDLDGLVDCFDKRDCRKDPVCLAPPAEAEVCDDGVDNDGDGLTDCEDRRDCRLVPACKTGGGGGKNR